MDFFLGFSALFQLAYTKFFLHFYPSYNKFFFVGVLLIYGMSKQSFNHAKGVLWKHGMFEDSMASIGMHVGLENGTNLYVSILDFGVSNQDIKVCLKLCFVVLLL